MAKKFTAQRNILTLDEREDLEDDEKEEFSEYESFFLYLIGQCRREGGKRVQGNDTGKGLGWIQIQARSHSIQYTCIRSTYSKTLPSRGDKYRPAYICARGATPIQTVIHT